MTELIRAKSASVQIEVLQVDDFMLPDGSYRMSQAQVAEAVGLGRQNLSDFLRSKAIKSLLREGFTGQKILMSAKSVSRSRLPLRMRNTKIPCCDVLPPPTLNG